MEDLNYNQTQPNQQHVVVDDIVVPNGAENRANHDKEKHGSHREQKRMDRRTKSRNS